MLRLVDDRQLKLSHLELSLANGLKDSGFSVCHALPMNVMSGRRELAFNQLECTCSIQMDALRFSVLTPASNIVQACSAHQPRSRRAY